MNSFDYDGAINEGYSDEEILEFISQSNPTFDFESAQAEGYSPEEIIEFFSESEPSKKKKPKEERSLLEKGARFGGQYALGLAEQAALPYEIATAPLASEDAQLTALKSTYQDELDNLLEQKAASKIFGGWTEEQEQKLNDVQNILKDPESLRKDVQTADISIQGLTEKATGLDLKPEGVLENAARWTGFIKNPSKLILSPKNALKSIMPGGKEISRGLSTGIALNMAEDGQFGPIGTMAAMVIGDLAGGGIHGGIKGAPKVLKNPKKAIANVIAKFTPADKKALSKDIIKEFNEAGIQADLGTLTDNNLIRSIQSRLAQSSLTGSSLDNFKKELENSIKKEYKTITNNLSKYKFQNLNEAGEVAQNALRKFKDQSQELATERFKKAFSRVDKNSIASTSKLEAAIDNKLRSLAPGKIKSKEQKAVIGILKDLKSDINKSKNKQMDKISRSLKKQGMSEKEIKRYLIQNKDSFGLDINALHNNKLGISDVINYEAQGGAKQLLKDINKEIDNSIVKWGKNNDKKFANEYVEANKDFREHAKTFRNREISSHLNALNPEKMLKEMDTIHGIKRMEKIFSKTKEGKEIFNALKEKKLQLMIADTLGDSTNEQIKMGRFSQIGKSAKDKQILQEILGKEGFSRFKRLQKNAGRLADTINKFYNASKSGSVAIDAAVIYKVMSDAFHILYGNPWPLLKSGGSVLGGYQTAKLLADPTFLKYVEEALLASEKNSMPELMKAMEKIRPYAVKAVKESQEEE